MSGDTSAAYAVFSFRTTPGLKLTLKGQFLNSRFLSFETYKSRLLRQHDSLLDFNMMPNPGSQNPFLTGRFGFDQGYEVDVVGEGYSVPPGRNVLILPDALRVQAIMMRVYDPVRQLLPTDLPQVIAVDALTGLPRACPSMVDIPFFLDFPQMIGRIASRTEVLNFKRSGEISGGNSAIPGYMYALTKMRSDDIAFVKFKAPRARYFSVCVQNFLQNETLGCLPDRMLRVDQNGDVYVAISEDISALNLAYSQGWNVLSFARARRQAVFGIVYRNILPESNLAYEGSFAPQGYLCTRDEYASGSCR
jgi:hypothetical protein